MYKNTLQKPGISQHLKDNGYLCTSVQKCKEKNRDWRYIFLTYYFYQHEDLWL